MIRGFFHWIPNPTNKKNVHPKDVLNFRSFRERDDEGEMW